MGRNKMAVLRRVTNNPILNILVGIIFLVTGGVEIWDSIGAELEGMAIGAHHGAVLFGALHAIRYLPDLFEGLEFVQGPVEGD